MSGRNANVPLARLPSRRQQLSWLQYSSFLRSPLSKADSLRTRSRTRNTTKALPAIAEIDQRACAKDLNIFKRRSSWIQHLRWPTLVCSKFTWAAEVWVYPWKKRSLNNELLQKN